MDERLRILTRQYSRSQSTKDANRDAKTLANYVLRTESNRPIYALLEFFMTSSYTRGADGEDPELKIVGFYENMSDLIDGTAEYLHKSIWNQFFLNEMGPTEANTLFIDIANYEGKDLDYLNSMISSWCLIVQNAVFQISGVAPTLELRCAEI